VTAACDPSRDRGPSPDAEAERDLVAAARRGDPAAVERLYRAHYGPVTAHVRRLVGADPDGDDLVQETFVAALTALRGFRGESRLSTWLHCLTVRVVRRHWRRRRFRRAREEDLAAERAATAPDTSAEPTAALAAREQARRLYAALATLSPKLREAFVLRHVEALELDEAAAVAGVRPGTLAVRCHRALAALRAAGFDALDGAAPSAPSDAGTAGAGGARAAGAGRDGRSGREAGADGGSHGRAATIQTAL
jgi:RNA polymerase sigma-70 factor (ECF subfamily)